MLSSLLSFSHFPCYPQSNWALLVLIPKWVVLCMFQHPVGLSNELFCEAGSFCLCLNPRRFFQSEVVRLYFLEVDPWVVGLSRSPVVPPSVSAHERRTTQSSSRYLACPSSPASTLPQVLSTQLPISTPQTSLYECFFFNSLVVGLPYSSIFCQFWLFFVFKFVVVLLSIVW